MTASISFYNSFRKYMADGTIDLDTDTFKVTLFPVVVAGVNEPVALAGNPVTANVTDPANPNRRVIVMA